MTPNRRLTADSKRSPSWETTDRTAPNSQQRPGLADDRTAANAGRDDQLPAKPPIAPDQVFFGLTARPQLRAADGAAGEIAADVGHPDDQQNENQRGKAVARIEPHQHRGELRRSRIEKSGRDPAATLRRKHRDDDETDAEHDQRSIEPARDQAEPGDGQRRRRPARVTRISRARPTTISHST